MKKDAKERSLNKKWVQLEKRGLKRPKDPAENLKRIREAHSG